MGWALHWESFLAYLTALFFRFYLDRMFSITLFFVLPLEELLGLPQALAEIGRIDIPTVGIPSDCHTGGIGRMSC